MSSLVRGSVPVSILVALCSQGLVAQAAPPMPPASPAAVISERSPDVAGRVIPGQWVVHCSTPAPQIDRLRRATSMRTAPADIATIVADLQREAEDSRRELIGACEGLGARVVANWWLVNAIAVEVDDEAAVLPALRELPGVAWLEPVREVAAATIAKAPLQEAVGLLGHNANAAHAAQWTGAIGSAIGIPHGIAVLDSELLTTMASAPTGVRHHAAHRVGGLAANATRVVDQAATGSLSFATPSEHGSTVASIAAGALLPAGGTTFIGSSNGQAPGADIVSLNVALNNNTVPTSSTLVLTNAWQWLASNAASFGVRVAVNSFGGDPNPLAVVQQALDACADAADVLVVVSAGNEGLSSIGGSSNRCWDSQYAINGVAVGAAGSHTHVVPSWASRGPMTPATTVQPAGPGANLPTPSGYERQYPDIVAAGEDTLLPNATNESLRVVRSGSSLAAPHVAGAAFLWLSGPDNAAGLPARTSLMAKATLLAGAEDVNVQNGVSGQAGQDRIGAGWLRTDWLTVDGVGLAQTSQEVTGSRAAGDVDSYVLNVVQGRTYSVAVAWKRTDYSTTAPDWADIDLEIQQGGAQLATSVSVVPGAAGGGVRRTWERATFVAPATGQVTCLVSFTYVPTAGQVTYALATTELPANDTFARLEPLQPTANLNCTTPALVSSGSLFDTSSTIPQLKRFTSSDCGMPPNCVFWQPRIGFHAFQINQGGMVEFGFFCGSQTEGWMDCFTVGGVPGTVFGEPISTVPGPNITGRCRARVSADGWVRGQIQGDTFLVLNFTPKMNWWDDRYVLWSQWMNPPYYSAITTAPYNPVPNAWHSTGPYWLWSGTFNAATQQFTNWGWAGGVIATMQNQWVQHRQWRFWHRSLVPGTGRFRLEAYERPRIGETVEVLAHDFVSPSLVVLGIGFAPATPVTPWLVTGGSGNCFGLLNVSSFLSTTALANGWAQTLIPVPYDPTLATLGIDLQSFVIDSNGLLATSNAVRAIVGF